MKIYPLSNPLFWAILLAVAFETAFTLKLAVLSKSNADISVLFWGIFALGFGYYGLMHYLTDDESIRQSINR